MKQLAKFFALTAIMIAFTISSVLANTITEVQLKTNAHCGSCKSKIEKSVNKLDGVLSSKLDLESNVLTVKFNSEKVKLDDIRAKIKKTGYDADLVDNTQNKPEVKKDKKCCDSKKDKKCCDNKKDK